ncbi:MAG: 4-(cytidine 5'-diphospho)-2-C-methyl-D-erythritol kinase [Alphaproteobacteria bacterium]|nr:4-(cytidine 5'-diphospho)-2-C-methyl-D-erythritol kinase [Alphaproteobacteria bacterium]
MNPPPSFIQEFAPAKLNLSLAVVGKRADGYHLLESLVAFADIGDRLTAEAAPSFALNIDGPFAASLEAGADNLVARAAHLFAERLGRRADVALRLTKNLPVASGIGGGSADAAATLRALSKLWAAPIPADLPAKLGADVKVCVAGVPAWMSGIGEIVEPAGALPGWGVVLVNPGIALATPSVFKARSGAFSVGGKFAPNLSNLAAAGNDLEAPAIALVPAIADVLAALRGLPDVRLARMSGSGATCFGLFDRPESAALAAKALKAQAPSAWWIAAGRVA